MSYNKHLFIKFIGLATIAFCSACASGPDKPSKRSKKKNNDLSIEVTQVYKSPGTVVDLSDSVNYAYEWTWSDYDGRVYTDTIKVTKSEVESAAANRLRITAISPTFPMPDYSILTNRHVEFAELISNRLKKIAQSKSLSTADAMNMAVTMVQNIPYTLVHNGSHQFIEQYEVKSGGSFIQEYHKSPANTPLNRELFGGCVDGVEPCGVYAPAEFASRLKGDCDTRTVFLYTVLKKTGFDVGISNGPGHSMLVTSLLPSNPAAPFIIHKGTKYYFWETTVFYNQPGMGTGPRNGDTPREFDASQWSMVLI
jgi:hypothetical protein